MGGRSRAGLKRAHRLRSAQSQHPSHPGQHPFDGALNNVCAGVSSVAFSLPLYSANPRLHPLDSMVAAHCRCRPHPNVVTWYRHEDSGGPELSSLAVRSPSDWKWAHARRHPAVDLCKVSSNMPLSSVDFSCETLSRAGRSRRPGLTRLTGPILDSVQYRGNSN